jgi:hypothetical protein
MLLSSPDKCVLPRSSLQYEVRGAGGAKVGQPEDRALLAPHAVCCGHEHATFSLAFDRVAAHESVDPDPRARTGRCPWVGARPLPTRDRRRGAETHGPGAELGRSGSAGLRCRPDDFADARRVTVGIAPRLRGGGQSQERSERSGEAKAESCAHRSKLAKRERTPASNAPSSRHRDCILRSIGRRRRRRKFATGSRWLGDPVGAARRRTDDAAGDARERGGRDQREQAGGERRVRASAPV